MDPQRFLANKFDVIGKWLSHQDWTDATFDKLVAKVNNITTQAEAKFGDMPPVDVSPLSLNLQGTADAAGYDTVATAHLTASITDSESVSVGLGEASFFAAAEEGAAYATTSASSDLSGADFEFCITTTVTGENWSLTENCVIAIDFDFFENSTSQAYEYNEEIISLEQESLGDGNVAMVDFVAEVSAYNSLVDVNADAIVIEDVYSGSSISAVLAIG